MTRVIDIVTRLWQATWNAVKRSSRMEKFRRSWRRSRTPTPSDRLRPVCSSLDLSPQPSSFADSEEARRTRPQRGGYDSERNSSFLQIPPVRTRRRSRSFDLFHVTGETPLSSHEKEFHLGSSPAPILRMLRRSFSRHSSSSDRGSAFCVHCLCVEEYERRCCASSDSVGPPAEESFPINSESSESDFDPNGAFSSLSVDQHTANSSRLSFLGGSIECHQKVEPWIRTNELVPDLRTVIRRGRSLGLATDISIVEPNLRRGGSESRPVPSEDLEEPKWQKERCKISFNISLSCSEPSAHCSTDSATSPMVTGRRSPGGAGTPRLERQEALSGWLESEPSLDLLAPGAASSFESRQVSVETHTSMETHASASLEVDSGASVRQRASIESQSSISIDVALVDSARHTSLDSQTSGDSMASSIERFSGSSLGSSIHNRPLLAQRRCLSAGASPCTSPPIYLSNSRFGLQSIAPSSRLNLVTGSSSEHGETEVEVSHMSPSPPAEIYLAVPTLAPQAAACLAAPCSASAVAHRQLHPSRLYRNDSTRSSSDKDPRTRNRCTKRNSSADSIKLHPGHPLRSHSIEVGLPTAHCSDYHKLAGSARRQQWVSRVKKSSPGEFVIQSENGERRVLRSTPDWTEEAINGDHLWIPTSVSGDLCYLGDQECTKTGPRMKCAACRIVTHINCIPQLNFLCRPTFWDGDLRQYRGNTDTLHHLVHRRSETGKCQRCSKSFQSKLSFSVKEIAAISCSWCKAAFHNKDTCFSIERLKEPCTLGPNANVIVPPSWIVKLPGRENFKSSLRKSPRKKDKGSTRRKKDKSEKESKAFVIKAIPSAKIKPIIVFINPKSGGNQGAKLMQKFQWLLNPRQVFDLTQGGPRFGLELFRKVPNVRVLACGGDGTAGWVLSILDQIAFNPPPPIGVLPLGTGNDLARAFGWGGGYTDEPISKILSNMYEAEPVMLDRWEVLVEKNGEAPPGDDVSHNSQGKENLPLNVVNNYFSFGVDAQIALDFHEAREARPQKFNSRLRNKMFYGQAGGKDLLQRKWKDLSEFVTIECDGKDITAKLREHKVHAVLFLNIPSYGGGTHPWNRTAGQDQATDDRLIEVVGLTTYQLPLLQAGGHGTCLTQCKTAKIVTKRVIPMQVDGEACRLNPSIITIRHLNQVPILAKRRPGSISYSAPVVEQIQVQVRQINMAAYEQHLYDKESLQHNSTLLGSIAVRQDAVLCDIRKMVSDLVDQSKGSKSSSTNGDEGAEKLQSDWCFIDSCTADRFFRVDMGQEHLHYITDITTDDLYILEQDSFVSDSQSTVELADSHLDDLEAQCDAQSNGRALSEDAGVDDMIELVNSELQNFRQGSEGNGSSLSETVTQHPEPEELLPAASAPPGTLERLLHVNLLATNYRRPSPLLEKPSEFIIKAAKAGDIKKLKDLHEKGYSLLSIDSQGQTALHWACRFGHSDIIKYLLACAPPSLRDIIDNERGHSALHKAAVSRQHLACSMLVASGANLFLTDHEGLTPLDLARRAGDEDLVVYLESQQRFQRDHPEDVETQV